MDVTDATFDTPHEGAGAPWVLAVQVEGSGFLLRAAPIVARVGDVAVERITVNLTGDAFAGLLRSFPNAGDKLQVGYLDTSLTTTALEYRPANV